MIEGKNKGENSNQLHIVIAEAVHSIVCISISPPKKRSSTKFTAEEDFLMWEKVAEGAGLGISGGLLYLGTSNRGS